MDLADGQSLGYTVKLAEVVRVSKGKMKIEFISKGFEDILCSEGAGALCEQQAKEIEERANSGLTAENTEGFKSGGKIVKAYGSKRWMYFVYTTDAPTMYAEQYDQTLTKAVN